MQIDLVVGRGSSGLPHIHNNSLISKFHSTEELSIMTFPFHDSKSALMFEKREWLSASLRCFKAISPKKLEIDRHIGLPIFFQIFEHFTIIRYRFCKKENIYIYIFFFINFLFLLFVTYIIIQSITSSEMCSLYLTHSSTHTWSSGHCSLSGWCSGEAPARPPHVIFNKIHLFETCWIILTFNIEPLFRQ